MKRAFVLDENDPVGSVFAPILGMPAWGVQKGHGSMLTFQFGDPSLRIREPIESRSSTSPSVDAQLRRRRVRPVGQWRLWIYCCNWRCLANDTEIAHSEATDSLIVAAADEMDGQHLILIEVDPASGTSIFVFDRGARLETWPYDEDENDEQWSLYCPSCNVFAYRKDGRYRWSASDISPDNDIWLPLPSDPGLAAEGHPRNTAP